MRARDSGSGRRGGVSGRSAGAVFLLVAAIGSALAGPGLAAGGRVNLLRTLAPQIAKARTGKVAVLLPASIRNDVAHRLYGSATVSANGYDIQLAYAPGCHDATACFFADFQAGPGRLTFRTRVALAHAVSGAFQDISCGASCAPASIEWREGGVLYGVQYVLGGKAAMIALANSAIDAGPR